MDSDPDLYISKQVKEVTRENCMWEQVNIGPIHWQLEPGAPGHSLGWYYIGVYGSRESSNPFTLAVALSSPSSACVAMVVEVRTLESGVACEVELEGKGESNFQYAVKTKPTTALLHVWADVSSSAIAIDVSTEKHSRPANYQWTTRKKEISECVWTNFTPFVLNDKGKIEYKTDREIPSEESKDDGWTGIIVDGYHWKYIKKVCYLRICNLLDKKITAKLTISEHQERDLIPAAILEKCNIFAEVFKKARGGTVSQEERNQKYLHGSEYTYGEIEPLYFMDLLRFARAKQGGVFWDLGSGAGKALVAAALGWNSFSRICGVEELEGLHSLSVRSVEKYCSVTGTGKELFKVVKGDMRKVDWSDADVVYASSICFPDDLVDAIAERGKCLKKGTIILSLKVWKPASQYKVVSSLQLKMSWGATSLCILEKL